ncbi:hypothetical protein KSP40_PGU022506 [Platanthera guangdongensis]|uniref:Uncharacterized protein n=1 Tax=Platanthera guangdongensis TaxID=2320717 RepID=A0ABR2MWG3_9ASPA
MEPRPSAAIARSSLLRVRKFARTVFEDVIALRANVVVVNVLALLLIENVIQMFAEIAGSDVVMAASVDLYN